MAITGAYWDTATDTLHVLERLPGGIATALAASTNGAVLVGSATDAGGTSFPARWDNGALTLLASITGLHKAVYCSQDGVIVVGAGASVTPYGWWVGGGTVAQGILPSPTTGSASWPGAGAGVSPMRVVSDTGGIIIGITPAGVTTWTTGTPTAIGQTGCVTCSPDGTVIVGTGPTGFSAMWTSGVLKDLTHDSAGLVIREAIWVNAAATRVYGRTVDTKWLYWDSLGTSGSFGFGVVHFVDDPSGDPSLPLANINAIADSNGIAVGTQNISSHLYATKWTDTTATVLPQDGTWLGSFAGDVSGNGSVTSGGASDADGQSIALYWDAANAIHVLPPFSAGTYATTSGISRDGAIVWGMVDASDTPPPPPSGRLAMDDVVCTVEAGLSSNLISLRWSDDRGHSYGNPVSQSMGEIGEYRTSLQWQRLAYARDRVFEISWSVPCGAALQGCWVDVTPAQS